MNKKEIIANTKNSHFFDELKKYPLAPYKIMTFSRDCDMVESTKVTTCLTYVSLIKDFSNWIEGLEWAEGAESWSLVDPKTETYHNVRDRVMENYENEGNGYMV